MKTYIKNLLLLPGLVVGLCLIPAGQLTAQTFTTLHNFNRSATNGANPYAGLIALGNTLFGTTYGGGGAGVIFAVKTDGTSFTNLHSFDYDNGASPFGGLILSEGTLYGTTFIGGSFGRGTVFKVNTNGTGFMNLHNFTSLSNIGSPRTNSDGANPTAGLILSGDTLYGTAYGGGNLGRGVVFAVKTDGTGFTKLHCFDFVSDGANPYAGLVLSGNTLFGATSEGGAFSKGTLFSINTDGTGFTNLYDFTGGNDGASPHGELILSGNTLYGTARYGGSSGRGTVFSINTNGTGFTPLHVFTNSDGAEPKAGLILSGNTLYGTSAYGGSSGSGIIFAVNTDGTGFTTLHSLSGGGDGANPNGRLFLLGNNLYGTAFQGGSSDWGTIFSLSLPPPPLNIALSGNQAFLFWSASGTNCVLESTTNLASPNWVPATDAVPVIAVAVTNSSPARFFRLMPQ